MFPPDIVKVLSLASTCSCFVMLKSMIALLSVFSALALNLNLYFLAKASAIASILWSSSAVDASSTISSAYNNPCNMSSSCKGAETPNPAARSSWRRPSIYIAYNIGDSTATWGSPSSVTKNLLISFFSLTALIENVHVFFESVSIFYRESLTWIVWHTVLFSRLYRRLWGRQGIPQMF